MQTINLTSIKKELTVAAAQDTAFKVFTEQMNLWWPGSHHAGKCPMTEMVLEARTGGRWYSKHEDGSEVNVGHVMTYQPYDLFILAWQLTADYQFDPELITEVEVQFIPEGPKTTRVKFEHKNLQKLHSDKAVESMNQGWAYIMDLYKQKAEQ